MNKENSDKKKGNQEDETKIFSDALGPKGLNSCSATETNRRCLHRLLIADGVFLDQPYFRRLMDACHNMDA